MAKVVLDAGHGGRDPGAVYNGRQEKDDNLRLALAVGELLENSGVDVEYTRTTDVYDTPYEKAQIANRSGADYFVSIHRNAYVTPNTTEGAEVLVYDDSGTKAEMARNINEGMEAAGFVNRGVIERPNLVVLRRTQMPAVLVEAGFIDSDSDNAIFDNNFDAIARGIADGILNTLNDTVSAASSTLYRVQVGAYQNRELAEELVRELQDAGFPAYLVFENGLYKVQAGAFTQIDNAVWMEQQLRQMGYQTYLVS